MVDAHPRGAEEGSEIALGKAWWATAVIRSGTSALLPYAVADAFQGVAYGLIQGH